MAGLNFDFTGNPSSLVSAAEQSRAALRGITQEAENAGVSVDNFLGATRGFVSAFTGIGIGTAGLASFGKQLINVRSEFQDTEARFKVFLGSEQKAADLMEELEDRAWFNNFEFSEITKSASQLLAFGTNVEEVGETIDRLSEIASGTGGSLEDLVAKFNKVKATGKMDSHMVDSFASLGVDVKSVLAEVEGKDRSSYEGVTLTFTQLQKVIHSLTDEGGKFFGMMKERGKNISDSMAGVRDNIALLFNQIGTEIQGPLKDGIDKTNEGIEWMMDNWQKVAKAIGACVVAAGAYKAAYAAAIGIKNAAQKANLEGEKKMLEDVTNALKEQYDAEIKEIQAKIIAGTAEKNADIELAVAKKQLTQAQADEIIKLRESVAAQVEALKAKAEMAAVERDNAAQTLQNITQKLGAEEQELRMNQEFVKAYEEKSGSIQEMIQSLGEEEVEQRYIIANSNVEIGTKKVNELQTQRLAASQTLEAATKKQEATAARADAAQQAFDTAGKKANELQTTRLGRAQIALKGIMQATGLSALANPYVLAAVAVAALCVGLYKFFTREKEADRAARELNETLEKQSKMADQVKDSMQNSVSTIRSNDKSVTDTQKQKEYNSLAEGKTIFTDDEGKAYDEDMQKIMQSAGKKLAEHYGSWQAMANATEDEIKSLMGQYADETEFAIAQKNYDNAKEKVDELTKSINIAIEAQRYGGNGPTIIDYIRLRKANKELEKTNNALKEVQKTQEDAKKSAEETAAKEEANPVDVNKTVADIHKAEQDLATARAAYAMNATKANEEALQTAENDLSNAAKRYKNQTGKDWQDSTKMAEEYVKAIEKLSNEEIKIHNSAIDDQRAKRKAEYEQTLKELDQEEKEYRRTHNGRSSGTLTRKKRNETIQYELDLKELDKQWKEWKANHDREVLHLEADIKMQSLQNQLENAMTRADKIAARKAMRKEEDTQRANTNRESADDEVLSKLGGNRDLLNQYSELLKKSNKGEQVDFASALGISTETANELQQIEEHYAKLLGLQNQQAEMNRAQEDYQDNIDNYLSYNEKMIELAQWRADELNRIQLGESEMTEDQVKAAYTQNTKVIQKEHGIEEGSEGAEISQIAEDLTDSLAGATISELNKAYQTFLEDANAKLAEYNKQKLDNEAAIKEQQAIINSGTATENEVAIAEQQITNLKQQQLTIDQNRAKLQTTMNNGEQQIATAMKTTTDRSSQQAKVNSEKWDMAAEAIGVANDACNALANSLGGALSKKGKKALGVVTSITQMAVSNIGNIKTLVDVSTKSMAAAGEGAAASLSAAEKASLILTIISMAVQAIQVIVDLVKQFSTEAKMQEVIDEDIARVDELKRANERLQASYEDESGTAYYKGMAAAAKDYLKVIKAQQKTVQDAQEKYNYLVETYGEDSDKVQEAKEQLEEQQEALEEAMEEQKEMLKELAEDLLATSLDSFTQSAADSFVENMSNGMNDVDKAWDETLNNMKRNMMKKGLEIALQNLFKSTFDDIAKLTEDGELTQAEMDQIFAQMDAKGEQAKQIAEQYYDEMEKRGLLSDEGVETSSKGFAAMSQDTGDSLDGKFTAVQIAAISIQTCVDGMSIVLNQLGVNDALKVNILQSMSLQIPLAVEIAQNQLMELRTIESNTFVLYDIDKRVKSIEQNTNVL